MKLLSLLTASKSRFKVAVSSCEEGRVGEGRGGERSSSLPMLPFPYMYACKLDNDMGKNEPLPNLAQVWPIQLVHTHEQTHSIRYVRKRDSHMV